MMFIARTVVCEICGVPNSRREVEAGVPDAAYSDGRIWIRPAVVVKFASGKKLHTSTEIAFPSKQESGVYQIAATTVLRNKRGRVVGWKDAPEQTNSGWTDK